METSKRWKSSTLSSKPIKKELLAIKTKDIEDLPSNWRPWILAQGHHRGGTEGHHDPVGVGSIFAFGLVAFGFLCMGPVNIAVDSYGPVTDNAQSIFELAQTEHMPGIKEEIQRDFGFEPNFEQGKHYLEANDSAGNTFKATAKPVLIGTAVVGATTMIFAIILLLGKAGMLHLSLTDAPVLLGFICGGAVIFWFCGASMQAVTTGAYRAVEFIKQNLDLSKTEADLEDSKTVVRICTEYAQAGMWNIFIALMCFTLAFALFDPNFFVAYLVSIAVFGLFQAIYMANAGGAWDNAKKYVEVDLKEKGTDLHAATVVGDTVGDPFKDTTSVSLNPIIKFSTLFGLLAVEIAIGIKEGVMTSWRRASRPSITPGWSAWACWRSHWSSCGVRSTPCGFRRRPPLPKTSPKRERPIINRKVLITLRVMTRRGRDRPQATKAGRLRANVVFRGEVEILVEAKPARPPPRRPRLCLGRNCPRGSASLGGKVGGTGFERSRLP